MTSKDAIWARVRGMIADVFDDYDVVLGPTSTAADVEGWDSVSHIEFMVALEQELGIRFNTGEMAALKDMGQLVDRIALRLGDG